MRTLAGRVRLDVRQMHEEVSRRQCRQEAPRALPVKQHQVALLLPHLRDRV